MNERNVYDEGLNVAEGQQLHGSQRWLQVAVNRGAEIIDGAMADAAVLAPDEPVRWVSPLESDGFREYRDQEFLERLEVRPASLALSDFWPRRGPRWDALAITGSGRRLLVEAKANIREFNSDPSRASRPSLTRIRAALSETKDFLRVRSETDWSCCFYQYANRIAHLYFLRELNGVDAKLVFVYFLGDTTVPGRDPVTREGWEAAISLANEHLGLPTSSPWLRENVAHVFIDVNDLRHIEWP